MAHKMMRGTGGDFDYLIVGRRGTMGLGLKPNVMADGRAPGTTYIGFRLRSASIEGLFDLSDEIPNIANMKLTPVTAWPEVKDWEKSGVDYCSTQVGVFLKGTLSVNRELLKEQIINGVVGKSAAKFIASVVGAQYAVLDEELIAEWVNEHYAPLLKKIEDKEKLGKKIEETIDENIGVFGVQSKMLKKMYNDLGSEQVEDIEPDNGPENDEYDKDAED